MKFFPLKDNWKIGGVLQSQMKPIKHDRPEKLINWRATGGGVVLPVRLQTSLCYSSQGRGCEVSGTLWNDDSTQARGVSRGRRQEQLRSFIFLEGPKVYDG